jgi:hypothetical protein
VIRCAAALLAVLGSVLRAQDSAQHERCRDPHRAPICASYLLFEFNAGGNVAGTEFVQSFQTKRALPSWFGWDVGWMKNISPRSTLGAAVEIGGSEAGTRLALRAKHRRWLKNDMVFDASAGPLMAQRQTGDGVVPTYGGTADIGFGRARVLVGTVNIDVARQQGTTALGVHLGGRTESRGVAVVSIAAAIGGLIVAAALSDGLY